jgi:ABC-type antimicrobial peptide transport system permease subunit
MRQGLAPVAGGLVIGAAVATGVLRFGRSLLFEVSPHDPAVLFAGVVVLGAVAAAAVLVPAWRAARVHPARALRSE